MLLTCDHTTLFSPKDLFVVDLCSVQTQLRLQISRAEGGKEKEKRQSKRKEGDREIQKRTSGQREKENKAGE